MRVRLLFLLSLFVVSSAGAIPRGDLVRKGEARTVAVQLFEWPWKDIASECENYLGPAGFAAAQVSPPYEHLNWEGEPWWERYQPISYQLVSRAGDEAEFQDMVRRCNSVGVDIYVDVVLNHMAGMGEGVGHAGSPFIHYEYPGLYSYDDFHHCGRNGNDDIENFGSSYELQNCELLNLADLDTGKKSVQLKLAEFLNKLLDMGVRGLRLDAAKHIHPHEIQQILGLLKSPSYIYQELILSPGEPVFAQDYTVHGDITLFGASFDIGRAFKGGDLGRLFTVGESLGYVDSERAVVFLENHDLQRNVPASHELLSYQREPEIYSLAHVFLLAWPYGYPRVYSSYSFLDPEAGPPTFSRQTLPVTDERGRCRHPWLCEHRLPEVAPMVHFRNQTNSVFEATKRWSNGVDRIAFSRGDRGFVAINSNSAAMNELLSTDLPAGEYCNLLGPDYDLSQRQCLRRPIKVDSRGSVQVALRPYEALVLLAE